MADQETGAPPRALTDDDVEPRPENRRLTITIPATRLYGTALDVG
ncbi:hypothetical protein [Kribbella sancticallisti]